MAKASKKVRKLKLTKHRINEVFDALRLNDPKVSDYMKYLQHIGTPTQQEPVYWIKSDSITCTDSQRS